MDPRKRLIAEAKNVYGDRLVVKEHLFLTTFYLDEAKRGNGFFWVYKRLSNRGYRVQFQKVEEVLRRTKIKGFGGYPMKYLRNLKEINEFLFLLNITERFFDNRIKNNRKKVKSKRLSFYL